MRAGVLCILLCATLAVICTVAFAQRTLSSSASSVRASNSAFVSSTSFSRSRSGSRSWSRRSSRPPFSTRSFSSRRSNSQAPRSFSSRSFSNSRRSRRSRSRSRRSSPNNGDKSYTYYVLATSWVGSVCLFKKCSLLASRNPDSYKRFNLHGLWPSSTPSSGPEQCSTERFSFEALPSGLREQVNLKWSGLYSSTQAFLTHEWSKHGTCWNPNQGTSVPTSSAPRSSASSSVSSSSSSSGSKLAAYFTKALELADRYNIYDLLAKSDITPRDGQTYDISAIRSAVKKVTGTDAFNIQCQFRAGQPYLYEVRMCLDLHYRPVACQNYRDNCNGRALYPKFVPQ